jgi:L-lactate permease
MEIITSAIYDLMLTFGLPAETGKAVAEALGQMVSFFADIFGFLGGLIGGISA